MSESLWELEERFWTAGENFYALHLGSDPVMLFPGAGVMRGQAITDALAQAPRWLAVEMTNRVELQPTPDSALLAYRAHGRRADVDYHAWCSSTYVRHGETWRLVHHQQTPA